MLSNMGVRAYEVQMGIRSKERNWNPIQEW